MKPFVRNLVEVVKLLALDAPAQLQVAAEVMASVATPIGELADLYGDSFDMVSEAELEAELSAAAPALSALREATQAILEDPAQHTAEALASTDAWAEVRALARTALNAAGIEPSPPKLDWLNYG